MVLQWARAKEEIDLGKTMKGAQPKTFLQAVCFDMKGCNANGRWLQRPKQENQAPSQHSQAWGELTSWDAVEPCVHVLPGKYRKYIACRCTHLESSWVILSSCLIICSRTSWLGRQFSRWSRWWRAQGVCILQCDGYGYAPMHAYYNVMGMGMGNMPPLCRNGTLLNLLNKLSTW